MSATSNALLVFCARASLCLGVAAVAQPVLAQPAVDGREIAQRNCSRCHAIGPNGDSRVKNAPPFRDLSDIADMDDLVNALHDGLLADHPVMPKMQLTQKEITALAAYLRDIQAKRAAALNTRPHA